MKSISQIREKVLSGKRKTIAVAAADDMPVLEAVKDAIDDNLADAALIGNKARIEEMAAQLGINMDRVEIIDEPDVVAAAEKAVALVKDGKAHVLMKGLLKTPTLLKAVLDKEKGLRTGGELSHVGVFEIPGLDRLLVVSDPAMHILPSLEEKVRILGSIKTVTDALEIKCPKVAAVCAIEVFNPKMPATVDADAITKMYKEGKIKDMIVDGPMALDIAVSAHAAEHKGYKGEIQGDADALLMPNIEAGNVMWKTLVYLAQAKIAGIVVGAAAPVVLTSRSDSPETKLNSIMLSLLM